MVCPINPCEVYQLIIDRKHRVSARIEFGQVAFFFVYVHILFLRVYKQSEW